MKTANQLFRGTLQDYPEDLYAMAEQLVDLHFYAIFKAGVESANKQAIEAAIKIVNENCKDTWSQDAHQVGQDMIADLNALKGP